MLVMKEFVEKAASKVPSMKPRGVAFAIESMANLPKEIITEEMFKRMEKVVISKFEDFIPHYMVKTLHSYYKVGYGSGELYDKLINGIISAIKSENEGLKYSDMLRFFEIFPEVTYIFDSAMSEELYNNMVEKVSQVIKDKKFPTEDVCRVFNIMVRLSPFHKPT
jgi:hypothetical protein